MPVQTKEATVTLLYVFEELETEYGGVVSLKEHNDVPDTVTDTRDRLEAAGFTVEVLVTEGDTGDAIVSVAQSEDADQIVIGGRKRSPSGKALFGSVTQSVVLNSDIPVTVVPESLDVERNAQ